MIRSLKEEIKKLIDPIVTFAFDVYPKEATFPRAIGSFQNMSIREGLHIIPLDIDVWDKGTSTKKVDELSEKIIDILNMYHCINDHIEFTIWSTNVLPVGSEDETLKRNTCIFEIQLRRL